MEITAFVRWRSTLRLLLTMLFLSRPSPTTAQELGLETSFLQTNDLLLSQSQPHNPESETTMQGSFEPEQNGMTLRSFDADSPRRQGNDALQQTFTQVQINNGESTDSSPNLNQTVSKMSSQHRLDIFPQVRIRQSIAKGEAGWLTRQKSIESLWIHNIGADPKSSLGTAFAFNAPTPESLAFSNVSILLEFASLAFLHDDKHAILKHDQSLEEADLESLRIKRQNRLSPNSLIANRNTLSRLDITPFLPAQEYIAKCGISEDKFSCDGSNPYRTYSGWCNNLVNPSWGKSVRPFDRMIPAVYADGISIPKSMSVTGRPLPSPRLVSSTVHVDVSHLSQKHTLMFMQFAQFLDHDITHTPVNRGPRDAILNCRDCNSTKEVHPECWPIPVPASDNYYPAQAAYSSGKSYCIPFTRSLPGQQRLGPREQINQNSAYLDSSHIYGESYCKAMSLRTGGGMLNVTFHPAHGGKVLMPQITQMRECKSPSGYCFYAGDPRASEQPALAALHTIFLREHNKLAEELHRINPTWTEEKIYQQARRILSAMNQHITYNEFLPRLIGPSLVNAYGLRVQNEGYYAGYDPTCSATALNEFATAAFRYGHSLIRAQIPRMDNRYHGMVPNIPLRDGFFNSDMLYKSLMVDEILRGLLGEPMEQLDPFVTKEITNHLFEDNKKSFSGMDLISLNLHRGRDHGLPGYNAYRAICNLQRATNFADLQTEIPLDVIGRLQMVYDHVDDIDLFTGSLVERAVNGGIIGPTMSCIIASQFKRLRQCDRFWYETNDPLIKFTPQQLAEIRKATLSKVLCDNMDMSSEIQKNAFDAPHHVLNPRLPCNRLPTILMEAWRESPGAGSSPAGCTIGSRPVRVGEAGFPTPCVSCVCTPEGAKCASLRITNCARLFREARHADILQDNVCTSQCGFLLGNAGNTAGSLSQQNELQLQSLQPPAPYHLPQAPAGPARFTSHEQRGPTHSIFNIVNGH